MRFRLPRLLVIPLIGLSAGCTVLRYQIGEEKIAVRAGDADGGQASGTPETRVSTPGTRAEVMKLFGPPDKIGRLDDDRYAFAYEYREVVEQQIGISIPKLELLKLAVGRTGARRETLLIEFSKDDRVLAAGVAHWQEDVGFGANIQLFITLTPPPPHIVNVNDMRWWILAGSRRGRRDGVPSGSGWFVIFRGISL